MASCRWCQADFDGLHPVDGKINAQQAKQKMVEAPPVREASESRDLT